MSSRAWTATLADDLTPVTVTGPLDEARARQALAIIGAYGFVRLRSAPAGEDTGALEARRAELLDFGAHLGSVVIQSLRRELVEDVRDHSDTEVDDRGYRSAGEMLPHSDPTTLIVLHCVRPARSGGHSRIVSVSSIVEAMRRERPDLTERLFDHFPRWQVAGQFGRAEPGPGADSPVLTGERDAVSCLLYRPYIERSAAAQGRSLTDAQVEALDLFERHSTSPELRLEFPLDAGDTLVLHNRSVLHARTEFDDWPEVERRRHLLRLWIDAPQHFPVDPAHELGDFFAPRAAQS